ncbi:orotate phosphoribosyltransferase-like protein [Bradyrhizobium algeriense]|uniref:Orotate phosphoribosyltransferase-like protein n=1 Tax=Bradyrhizobium algeriense TaxID=634784 RepID=A0ABU8B455_9BRAD
MDSSNIAAVLDRFDREMRQPNPIAETIRRAAQALNCPLVNGVDTNGCSTYTKVCSRYGGLRTDLLCAQAQSRRTTATNQHDGQISQSLSSHSRKNIPLPPQAKSVP